jgi:hypothetical protein
MCQMRHEIAGCQYTQPRGQHDGHRSRRTCAAVFDQISRGPSVGIGMSFHGVHLAQSASLAMDCRGMHEPITQHVVDFLLNCRGVLT